MKKRDFRRKIANYIRKEAKPADKYSHQPRLYALARKLARGRRYDDDVLYAAAWMHDLGVFVGHRPEELKALAAWDHVAYVSKKAPGVLKRLGFPAGKIPAVVETIRDHLPSAKPRSWEGTLLRDADILEQLGAVSILRVVSKVGRDTRFGTFLDALRLLRNNARSLPGQLQTPAARRLAGPRLKLMKAFLQAAESEAAGNGL